jgi:hypothetical protein
MQYINRPVYNRENPSSSYGATHYARKFEEIKVKSSITQPET